MGLRFRKSVSIGPFRVNASKSGLGWSVGVPGARYTKMANGRDRVTASIPGTGISWVEESKKRTVQQKPIEENEENLTGWPFFWHVVKEFLVILFYIGVACLFGALLVVIPFMDALNSAKGR